ncbi:MAG: dihydropteroate synthase [Acidobacteriota bacterium]|nr:dihydropteroate synthase [Acidobacteriota bacterium]MDE3266061.1 dihydropteroate synthase [Acidobacteriota bacterium]
MELVCGPHTLAFGDRPLVMGVLNVTPDSFSDGGLFDRRDQALDRARRMAAEGADLIDVGAESTRPGAEPVGLQDELARLLPVIEGIIALDLGVPLSVDTAKPEAADRALSAGAGMINDISGAGEAMLEVAARHGAPVIAMHMRGEPRTMQSAPRYDDVVAEIRDYLAKRVAAGRRFGVDVLVDPGIGFGKTLEHNLDLLANLRELRAVGAPVVLGTSRKSFLDRLLGGVAVEDRLAGTLAVNGWAAALDVVDVLRVHDVREHRQLAESIGVLRRYRRAPAPRRRVLARGIPCRCRIGVTARERSAPQDLVVDVEVNMAPAALGAPDALRETTDYAEIADLAQAVAAGGEYRLIETLAERIAVAVAGPADGQETRKRIESLRVRVSKPGAARELGVAEVGAQIDWRP